MKEIGLSTACFYPQLNTEDTLDIISNLGIKKIEVFLQTESEYQKKFIYELKDKINKLDLEVYSIHASSALFEPLLFSSYQREVTDSLKTFEKIFEACNILNGKYYVFHGPRLMSFTKDQWDFVIKRTKLLVSLAKEYNIRIAQENVSWCLSSNLQFLQYLKEKVEGLYFTYDNKQGVKSLLDSKDILKVMAESLVNVHISDVNGRDMGIFPGHGSFDFNNLFEELEKINYTGPVIIEVYGKYLPPNIKEEMEKFKRNVEEKYG
ncbi:sugar phosphate isomerase/epimerase family protein [Anaerobranca gottschalkii]|uniref:Sugar phosphate isomerase/epimerase n=1 Tax=Anaerobranca gottschalkii DSM 13577 TaxID=1120990 RepID=A0A1I0CQI4_9FIRM|nr:sugar phosphate isomerase/epimerase [Anaerobranca gottschalkii]SET21891.1 Sugar phosphate isomerase/epimerase [Anaerobranca gottschalkii DSM 13577]